MSSNKTEIMPGMAQALVGVLLCYAAVSKALAIPMFALVIQSTVPFASNASTSTLIVLAQAVVFVEIFVGASLVLHFFSGLMRLFAIGMFVAFSGILSMQLTEENPISCGCLGISPDGMGSHAEIVFGLMRNAFLIAILVAVSVYRKCDFSQSEPTDDSQQVQGV